jgi:hypothetical protein
MSSIAYPSSSLTAHRGVARVQRFTALVRGLYLHWKQARLQEARVQAQHAAALQEARTMAALARAMNGIAVEDIRRYRD